MKKYLGAIGALIVASLPMGAQAAVVTKTYAFSAQNFFPAASPPPVSVVTGSFTVTFDDAVDVFDTTTGLVINDLNIPVTSTISYSYETGQYGGIRFGGRETGQGTLLLGTNDILLVVPLNYSAALFYSSTLTPNANFFTDSVAVQITQGAASVPEQTTWAMMLFGFALAGLGLRRPRHQSMAAI
jgi:hypothetical protein